MSTLNLSKTVSLSKPAYRILNCTPSEFKPDTIETTFSKCASCPFSKLRNTLLGEDRKIKVKFLKHIISDKDYFNDPSIFVISYKIYDEFCSMEDIFYSILKYHESNCGDEYYWAILPRTLVIDMLPRIPTFKTVSEALYSVLNGGNFNGESERYDINLYEFDNLNDAINFYKEVDEISRNDDTKYIEEN